MKTSMKSQARPRWMIQTIPAFPAWTLTLAPESLPEPASLLAAVLRSEGSEWIKVDAGYIPPLFLPRLD